MNEKPMLFSAPMVLALLAGTKTQTRRRVNVWGKRRNICPHPVGSRIWVKETWRPDDHHGGIRISYGADCTTKLFEFAAIMNALKPGCTWRTPKAAQNLNAIISPLFMPRWASRITLEVTRVRVERLQDISEAEAAAEGIFRWDGHGIYFRSGWRYSRESPCYETAVQAYRALWESINGPGSWDRNPFVWVYDFKRV